MHLFENGSVTTVIKIIETKKNALNKDEAWLSLEDAKYDFHQDRVRLLM